MEPSNTKKDAVETDRANVKATVEKQDNTFFVTSDMATSKILAADEAGKKLIFDIVEFPEMSLTIVGKLSRENRIAYQMDARYAEKAGKRMAEGKSPYSDVKKRLEMDDPLGNISAGSPFEIRNKDPEMKYIFGDPRRVEAMQRAGYELVDPNGKEEIAQGVTKGGKVCILGDNNKVENVAMKVPKADYDKHMEIEVKKSQARLGRHLDETKEKMAKYAPKVTIYDKSTSLTDK